MAWDTSTRRSRLPSDWPKRRARILKRDPLCRIAGPACTARSTEVDHVIANDDHRDSNLQGLCATVSAEPSYVSPSPQIVRKRSNGDRGQPMMTVNKTAGQKADPSTSNSNR